jgi:phosphocarrier protein HPr
MNLLFFLFSVWNSPQCSSIIRITMVNNKAIINNDAGIHVRPSGVIINELGSYAGKIVVSGTHSSVELNSVMSLLTLGLMKGDEIEIAVTGTDEEKVCLQVKELMERIYDFPPRN